MLKVVNMNKKSIAIISIVLLFLALSYFSVKAASSDTKKIPAEKMKESFLPVFSLSVYKITTQKKFSLDSGVNWEKILNKPIPEFCIKNDYSFGETLEYVTHKKILLLNEYSPYGVWKNAKKFDYKKYKAKSKFWKYSHLSSKLKLVYFSGMKVGDLIGSVIYLPQKIDLPDDTQEYEGDDRYRILNELRWYEGITCTITKECIIFCSVPDDVYDVNVNESGLPL